MPNHLDYEETCLTYISSEHATSRTPDGHRFTVNMGNTTFAAKASGVTLNKVLLPNIFPNINAYRNTFTIGGATITIPVAFYSAADLATTITSLSTALLLDVNLTFTNERFTWTNVGVVDRDIEASAEIWDYLGWDWRTLEDLGGEIYRLSVADATPGPNTQLAPHPPALFGEKIVHVSCDKLSHGNLVHGADGKLHDVLCTVPLGETVFNFVKVWEPNSEKSYRVNYKYVNSISSTLDFQILDSRLRHLPFSPNHHIQIVLKTYHKEHD